MFPKLKNLTYIPKNEFPIASRRIEEAPNGTILLSREFNKSFKPAIAAFASQVDAPVYPIIVLRKHADWLISQYKRHIKNGYQEPIANFFPLGASGYLNPDALDFFDKISFLEETFGNRPIVLFYDELDRDPVTFTDRLGTLLGCEIPWKQLVFKRVHTSYSEHQLRFLYWSYQRFKSDNFHRTKAYRYLMLYAAYLFPRKWFQSIVLFPKQYIDRVNETYQSDWIKCQQYAEHQSR